MSGQWEITAFCNVCGAFGRVTVSGNNPTEIVEFIPISPPGDLPMWAYASGFACNNAHYSAWLNGNYDYWTKNSGWKGRR